MVQIFEYRYEDYPWYSKTIGDPRLLDQTKFKSCIGKNKEKVFSAKKFSIFPARIP